MVLMGDAKYQVYLIALIEDHLEEFDDIGVKMLFDLLLSEVNYRAGLRSGKPPFGSDYAR